MRAVPRSTLFPYTTLFRSAFVVLVLVAGSAFGQQEDGACGAISDDADAGPDVEGLRQAVAALGNEDNSLAGGFLNLVNGLLNRPGIVGEAVAADGKGVRGEVPSPLASRTPGWFELLR